MRYRKLDAGGDMMFGHSARDIWKDVPDGVAQAIQTRLGLLLGEWFLDTSDGTPWQTQILGKYTASTRNLAIQQRILETDGVQSIDNYSAVLNPDTRRWTVTVVVTTIYGSAKKVVISPGGFQ